MIKCNVCNLEFKNLNGVSQHVKTHNITPRDYFIQYPKQQKRCYKCGLFKERLQFYKDSYFNDGLSSLCKECLKLKINDKHSSKDWRQHKAEYDKQYRKTHKEELINRQRRYRTLNRDKRNMYEKLSYSKCPDKYKLRNKRYEQTEKGRIVRKKQVSKYQRTPKGRLILYMNNVIRRERINGLNDKLPNNIITKIKSIFQNKCFKCSSNNKLSIDHFYPLSKGYGLLKPKFNACLLCMNCNSKKYNRLPEEFFTKEEIERYNKISLEWR